MAAVGGVMCGAVLMKVKDLGEESEAFCIPALRPWQVP
jgi:hypothetical protein